MGGSVGKIIGAVAGITLAPFTGWDRDWETYESVLIH